MSNENGFKKFWGKNSTLVTMGLAVAVLGTSLYIMSTFSRNTSTMQGTDTGTVARFEYEIKQTEGADNVLSLSGTQNINIFDTAADTGLATNGGKTLAPGTAGYFEFLFRNKSNAPVRVTFDNFNYADSAVTASADTSLTTPIIFYFNGRYYSDLYDQPLSGVTGMDLGTAFNNKHGSDWTYYFNEGDAEKTTGSNPVTLYDNLAALQTALNQFSTNTTTGSYSQNATTFLKFSNDTDALDEDVVRVAWFFPFEARLQTGDSTLEAGTDPGEDSTTGPGYHSTGSDYLVYGFDLYCQNFISGSTTVTMEPKIRVSQIDEYVTNTKNKTTNDVDNYGYDFTHWYRKANNTTTGENSEVAWGENPVSGGT